jgi:hypothetical protein
MCVLLCLAGLVYWLVTHLPTHTLELIPWDWPEPHAQWIPSKCEVKIITYPSPFYRGGNWSSESSGNLLKVTKGSNRLGLSQDCLTANISAHSNNNDGSHQELTQVLCPRCGSQSFVADSCQHGPDESCLQVFTPLGNSLPSNVHWT